MRVPKTSSGNGFIHLLPLIIICILNPAANAQGRFRPAPDGHYSGGAGEPNDPYQIATAADLILLGETPKDYHRHFILTAGIDLDPSLPGRKVFKQAVIAPDMDPDHLGFQGTPFTGVFDGNDHIILGLTISNHSIDDYLGLFGQVGGEAEIKRLGLADVNVDGYQENIGPLAGSNAGAVSNCYSTGMVAGKRVVGGLVGLNSNGGSIMSSYSTASVIGKNFSESVGGLVGENSYESSITSSYSTGSVTGKNASRGVGGLVGSGGDGSITNCYSTGSVTGAYGVGGLVGNGGIITACYSTGMVTGERDVGGLVGGGRTITACYSTGTITGERCVGGLAGSTSASGMSSIASSFCTGSVTGGSFVGGLVGENMGHITWSYSTGKVSGNEDLGGLVGRNSHHFFGDRAGIITKSFWDMETSGLTVSDGGVGLTTTEMKDPYMVGLNGFAKDPNWILDAGRDCPRLAWEGTAGQVIPEPMIDWLDGKGTGQAPYRIETANQLTLLSRSSGLWDKHFVLGADIDLDPNLPGRQIFSQALIQVFSGVFNGNGHTISNLTIRGGSNLGLFGQTDSGARISNLGLEAIDIEGTGGFVGGLVGESYGSIAKCSSIGTVTGDRYVGGLVGRIPRYRFGEWLGGGKILTNCYSAGTVSGANNVGGLVGYLGQGMVTTCYSTGSVTGDEDVGGLVGDNNSGSIFSSVWDMETSGQVASAGGTGLTTLEMQMINTYINAGWDFIGETENGSNDVWRIVEGKTYPLLSWQRYGGGIGEPTIPI